MVGNMPTELQPSSQLDSDARLIEVIRKIRHQKQKPTVDRICHALLRDHDIELSLDAVECLLNDAVGTGVVTRISTNSGAVSYREPAEQSRVSVENSNTSRVAESLSLCSSVLSTKGKSTLKFRESASASIDATSCTYSSRSAVSSDAGDNREEVPVTASPVGRRKPTLKVDKQTDLSDAVLAAIERLEVASGKTLEKEIRCHYTFEITPGADVRHRIRVACKQLVEQRRLVKDGSVFQMASTMDSVDSPLSQDGTGTSYLEETDFSRKPEDNEDLMTSSIFVCSECKAIEEDRTNVISCAECGVDRHTKCMSRAALSLLKSMQLWLCQTCQPCPVCLTSSRTRKQRSAGLLVCELCDQVYHPECCSNLVQTKSKESWVCPRCQLDNNCIDTTIDTEKTKSDVDFETDANRLSPNKSKKTTASRNRSSTLAFLNKSKMYHDNLSDDAEACQDEILHKTSPSGLSDTPVSVNGHNSMNPESSGTPSISRRGMMNPQVKLTPLRNGDCNVSDTRGDDTSSVDTSSSTQRKRSKNVQLSSLFDSLTQFFSTTSARRRRTPFVSSFVSDISATAWWKNSEKSATRAGNNSKRDTALNSADKSSTDKSKVVSRKSDPVKPITNTVSSKATARRCGSLGVSSRRRNSNERRHSVTSETEAVDNVKWLDVNNDCDVKKGHRVSSVDGNSTDSVERRSSCSSVESPVVARRVVNKKSKERSVKIDTEEWQKMWKTKCQEHQQLTEDVVEGRITDGETKLFIMAQTIAQQRLLVSEGIYVLDEEADKNPVIVLGKYRLCTPVALPRSTEFISSSKLYICEFCFKWSISRAMLGRHLAKCSTFQPPGCEIYRHKNLSMYEVEGHLASSYCSSLSLFARLLVGDETVCSYPASEHCLFYILRRNDSTGSHLIGYFTKMRKSPENLSSLFVLPCYENDGFTTFLIDFSYQLCKLNSSVGSLPLSMSSQLADKHKSYLKSTILDDLIKHRLSNGQCTVDGISCRTAITIEDVLTTLSTLHVPIDPNTGAVNATITKLKDCARRSNIDFKSKVPVDSDSIRSSSNFEEINWATQNVTSEPVRPSVQMTAKVSDVRNVVQQSPVVKKLTKNSMRAHSSQKILSDATKPPGRPTNRKTPVDARRIKPVDNKLSGRRSRELAKSYNQAGRRYGAKCNQNYLSRNKKLGHPTTSAVKRLRPRVTKLDNSKHIPEAKKPSTTLSDSSPERSTSSPAKTPIKTTQRRQVTKPAGKGRNRQSGVILRRSPRMGVTAVTSPSDTPVRADETTDDEVGNVPLAIDVGSCVNGQRLHAATIDTVITPSAELLERDVTQKSVSGEDHKESETDTEDELVDVLDDNHSYGCKTPSTDIDRCDYPQLDQSLNEDQLPKLTADVESTETGAIENTEDDDKEVVLSDTGSIGLASPLIVDTSPQESVDHTNDNQVERAQNETGYSSSYSEKTSEDVKTTETRFSGSNLCSEDDLRITERPSPGKVCEASFHSDKGVDVPAERSSCLRIHSGSEQPTLIATESSAKRVEECQKPANESNSHVTNRETEVKLGMMWRDGRFSTDIHSSSLERCHSFTTAPEHENLFLPRQTSATSMMLPAESRKRPHGDYASSCQPATKHSPLTADWESRATQSMLASRGTSEITSLGLAEMHGGRSSVSKFDTGSSSCNQNSSLSKFRSSDLTVLDSGYRSADIERPASTMSVDRGLEPIRTHKGSSSISDRYSHGLGYGVMSPLDTQAAAAVASSRYLSGSGGSHGNSAHRQRGSGGSSSSQNDQQQRLSHVWSGNPVPAHQHPSTHLQHLEDLPYCAPPKGHAAPSVPTPPSLSMTPPIVRMTPPPSATSDAGYARTCQQQQQPQRQHNRQHHKTHKQMASNNAHPSTNTARSATSPQFAVAPGGVAGTRGRASPSFSATPAGYDMFSAACHMQQPIGYFAHHQGAPALQMVGLTHAQMAVAAAANFGQQMHAAATAGAQPNSAAYSAAAAAAYNYLNGAGLQPFNVDINTMMRR